MAFKKTFWDRILPKPKHNTFNFQTVIYHLEVLPINKQSFIIMNTVAKLKLTELPTQKPLAWKLAIKDHHEQVWIPYSCIKGWIPATNEITIQTWILRQKGIKYKTA